MRCANSKHLGPEGRERRESGVALILVMLAMLVMVVLAATIVFTARSETLASYNFKLDTQADYLAKAGIQQAVNWLRSSAYAGVTPANANTYYNVTDGGAPYHLFTTNMSPVTCKANCPTSGSSSSASVQLMGIPGTGTSNYPNINNGAGTAVATQFAHDLGAANSARITGDARNSGYFLVNAVLLNFQTVNTGQPPILGPQASMETWLITSRGYWTGTSSSSGTIAMAEEQAVVQPIYSPAWGNALYGYCSLKMQGSNGVCTDAFNSAYGAYAGADNHTAAGGCSNDPSIPNVIDSGAGVGSNGGVTISSNVTINGDVTIGTGAPSGCPTTNDITGTINGEVVSGPHINPPSVPTFPTTPVAFPTGAANINSGTWPRTNSGNTPAGPVAPPGNCDATNPCVSPCAAGVTCNGTATNPFWISTLTGTPTIVGGPDIYHPVYYDIDTINMTGNDQISIVGYVVWNVRTDLTITGKGLANTLLNAPETLQINYAGTNEAHLGGNGELCAVVTAPLATVALKGSGSNGFMVGSVQANNVDFQGGYPIHYDLQLSKVGGVVGVTTLTAYTRKKM